jgi:NAD dependent epimerase/dehydratase family
MSYYEVQYFLFKMDHRFMIRLMFLFNFGLLLFTSRNVYSLSQQPPQNQARVLIIGGTRFSGASLWKELYDRGHDVTVYNRGKTSPKPLGKCGLHFENESSFNDRMKDATFIQGDRQDPDQLRSKIDPNRYDYVYDMNARTLEDTKPLAELFVGA